MILAALSSGSTVLEGALFSRDTKIMLRALEQLGFQIKADPSTQRVEISEKGRIPNKKATLDVGNGTAARFLTAMLHSKPAANTPSTAMRCASARWPVSSMH